MKKPKFYSVLGLAGVNPDENPTAVLWGKIFEWPMLLLAIWILFLWHFEITGNVNKTFALVTDIIVWGFFVIEFILLTTLVDKKFRYFITNWINVVIIAAGLPVLWGQVGHLAILRTGRLLIMIVLLVSTFESIRKILSNNKLGVTLGVGLLVVFIAGILISGFDPAIHTPWEGIWWAWVTVTTVGYGDVVPTSVLGKVFACFLILLGIGLFSLLTASFSVFFISQQEQEIYDEERKALKDLEKIRKQMETIENKLDQVLKDKH